MGAAEPPPQHLHMRSLQIGKIANVKGLCTLGAWHYTGDGHNCATPAPYPNIIPIWGLISIIPIPPIPQDPHPHYLDQEISLSVVLSWAQVGQGQEG